MIRAQFEKWGAIVSEPQGSQVGNSASGSAGERPFVQVLSRVVVHELQGLRKFWWCFLVLGIVTSICGVCALTYPFVISMGVTIAIGLMLLISGISTIITSFWTGKWSAFLVHLLMGIVYVVVGLSMAEKPLASTAALTMLVASFAVVGGAFRIVAALALRFPQWGWVLVNGLVTLLFGVVVLRHIPEASVWLIGMIVGIDLLFTGVHWIMLGLEVRSIPKEAIQA